MKALLFIGGANPDKHSLEYHLSGSPYICAADSGLETVLAWHLAPDLIVGDMDSLKDPGILLNWPENKIIRAPVEKDETDTELALTQLKKRGAKPIVMIGGGGGRIDHFIALLALFERPVYPDEWFLDGYKISASESEIDFDCRKGDIISVFPVGNDIVNVSSVGLKWKLDGLVWMRGDSGVSNVAVEDSIQIIVHTGRVIVVTKILTH